ncbi:tripartite tricarboxylate transporter permease [Halalkalibacterium ligniniphilum]|uniref:tripartite tricarboxylate transporter permease n=1 Tax=Halalkalibacterium ligniniphilum TaxID=1134413 RepID=UPI00034D51DB|nr:tripartite tricarboxylate transporter permease [Halalkalibacterium ligniniphilum]
MAFLSQFGALFTWELMLLMLCGVLLGLVIGTLPGLGGGVALALLIPITFGMSAQEAIVLLLAAYGTVTYGGSITAILINTPGEASNAATTFDGFPLAQQGKGGMAITVAVLCSAIGGIIGFILLALLIPVARQLVMAFSYPEFFMLAVFGLTIIAVVTKGNVFRALISALFGLMLAFIGTDPTVGSPRFTFETTYLWDGIAIIPVIIGLFAITEAFDLYSKKTAIAKELKVKDRGVREGVAALVKNYWLFLRSCLTGFFIGIVPGVGGVVASFMAYGTAVQMSKTPEKFGKGAIEGVIAVEAANDAKDGGALLPTLAFGIPGSAAMAVFIGGLIMHGLAPGPEMLTRNLDMTYFLIAAGIVSKVVALAVALLIGTRLVFITKVRGSLMAPGVIGISLVGAYALNGNPWDVVIALLFGVIGMYMRKFSYSAIALTIALVLGGLVESSYHQTMVSFGVSGFFTRPIAVILLILTIISLALPLIKKKVRSVKEGGVNL